jgi:hypothetical protein
MPVPGADGKAHHARTSAFSACAIEQSGPSVGVREPERIGTAARYSQAQAADDGSGSRRPSRQPDDPTRAPLDGRNVKGLANMDPPESVFTMYSAGAGETALIAFPAMIPTGPTRFTQAGYCRCWPSRRCHCRHGARTPLGGLRSAAPCRMCSDRRTMMAYSANFVSRSAQAHRSCRAGSVHRNGRRSATSSQIRHPRLGPFGRRSTPIKTSTC